MHKELPELLGGEYITSSDGKFIYAKTWHAFPQGGGAGTRPKAVVTFFHGLNEHILRYQVPFTKLAESGIQIHGWDYRGHGRTLARNNGMAVGWTEGWKRMLEDAREAILRTQFEDVPHFLLGMSFGGAIALAAAARLREFEFAGVIALAPMLEINPKKKMPWIAEKLLVNVVSPILPSVSIKNRILGDDLSTDPMVADAYFADPMNVQDRIVIGTVAEMIRTGRYLMKDGYKNLDMPVLMHVGDRDGLVNPSLCSKFYERLIAEDKKLVTWQGAAHELLNEPFGLQEMVLDDIKSWILERSKKDGNRKVIQMSIVARLVKPKL